MYSNNYHDEDDFSVEIVDLEPESQKVPAFLPVSLQQKREHNQSSSPWHQRRWQAMISGGTALLILLFLFWVSPLPSLLSPYFIHPTPPTITPASDNQFYFTNLSRGTLLIDGTATQTSKDHPLTLPSGRHTLVWHASPLIDKPCILVVPLNPQQTTCEISPTPILNTATGIMAWSITVPDSFPPLTQLPPSQRATLIQSVQAELDTHTLSTTIQSGEPYATTSLTNPIAIAQEPLQARMHLVLDTEVNTQLRCIGLLQVNGGECQTGTQDCHQFCDTTNFQLTYTNMGLDAGNAMVVVRAVWDYLDQEGNPIALNQPDSVLSTTHNAKVSEGYESLVLMQIAWNGAHWQSKAILNAMYGTSDLVPLQPAYATSWEEQRLLSLTPQVSETTMLHPALAAHSGVGSTAQFWSGQNLADGVLISQQNLTKTGQGTGPLLLYHRFGILYAVNPFAHQTYPSLPLITNQDTQGLLQHLNISASPAH
ncbi:hypothetical protein [Tengunoibacter tsumagoiensis]|uniref:Uncharacterized protein n=1 Tax=Tengunoibacter tsumagoiensis TaxID=2014871 RepID=A0A401ZX27_9CHLR|nr:hypothetical protein [Tengunoibacter tsumagoiensis]GCE11304.1 hypothetical protein KTT_11630 [Tengunoibacter tsumagoiensis]